MTGFDYGLADLLAAGERVVNIARGFNAREGFSKKDDALPGRFTETMLRSGLAKGGIVSIDSALAEYYALCGWNEEGVPTREKLLSLGLKFVSDALYGSSGLTGQARASL